LFPAVVATPRILGVATTVSSFTGEPRTSRKYAQEQKDAFFVVFERLKSAGGGQGAGLLRYCAGWCVAGLKPW
jgi:hypothetical protein